MHDLVEVRVFECRADLCRDLNDPRELRRTRLRQAWTKHELHYEKRQTVLFADVVNGNDMWMVECGRGSCFPGLKPAGFFRFSCVREEFFPEVPVVFSL